MKKFARFLLDVIGAMFGKRIFTAKRFKTDFRLLDCNMLSYYWNRDEAVVTYENSMHRTGMAWSDELSKRCRYYSLYQMMSRALDQNATKGDVAECGCWRGHSAHMLASIMSQRGFPGKFHIFDSFEGLSEVKQLDQDERFKPDQKRDDIMRKVVAASEELVRSNLSEFDFIDFYKGWIPERFPDASDRSFILVHIDLDLYDPIRDSIEFFYPRLVEGGIMVFDDYGLSQFPGTKLTVDEAVKSMSPSFFYEVPTGGSFMIK